MMTASALAVAIALALMAPAALSITAPNAILVNAASGEVLFERNADEPVSPSALAQLMTLLVVAESIGADVSALDDMVIASPTAAEAQGSQIFLEAGETMPLRDLVASIALGSANDSCIAVAEHTGGTEKAFVEIMNARAAELGMGNTRFSTCTGLPKGGTMSSARDIAKLAIALNGYTWIMEWFSASEYSVRDGRIALRNTNRLISQYEGAYGFKAGYNIDAGFCIAAAAERHGVRLVAVILGAANSANRFTDAAALLDWGFASGGLAHRSWASAMIGAAR